MGKVFLGAILLFSQLCWSQLQRDSLTFADAVGVQEIFAPQLGDKSSCADTLSFNLPAGHWIYGVEVEYTLQGTAGFFGSSPADLETYLESPSQASQENQLFSGTSNVNGASEAISRTGLTFANGPIAATPVTFVLHAFINDFFGAACDTNGPQIQAGSWQVTVIHGPAPTCFVPSNPMLNYAMHDRAQIAWTSGGSNAWQLEYGSPGFALGSGTRVNAQNNPFEITGLNATTAYEVYVRDSCGPGDLSGWVGPLAFVTLCNPLTFATQFTEDFDGPAWSAGTGGTNAGNLIGTCWTRNPESATGGAANFHWGTGTGATPSGGTGPNQDVSGSGNYVYTEASAGANQDVALLTSPLLDLSSLTLPELEFNYHRHGTDVGGLQVEVWSRSQGWQTVWAQSGPENQASPTNPWLPVFVTLNAFANDTVLLRFRGIRSFGFAGDLAIDEVLVKEAPACPDPSNLRVLSRSTNNLQLAWNATAATAWQIEFGPQGFSQGGGTLVTLTSNPGSVGGLTAGTAYDFYLRSLCGAGGSSRWIGPISTATFCTAVAAPYQENFDATPWRSGLGAYNNGDSLAPCWYRQPGPGLSGVFPVFWGIRDQAGTTPNTGPAADQSGGNFAYLESSAGSVGQTADLESPFIDLSPLTVPELRFYHHLFGNSMGSLAVDVYSASSANWTPGVYQVSGQQQQSANDPWTLAIVDLSAFAGDSVVLRFRATKGNERRSDMAIDAISIGERPSCPQPDSLQAGNVTNNSADLSWLSGGASNWQLSYGTPGFSPASGTIVNAASNPFTLTGLGGSQSLEIYVRDSCGPGDVSNWVGPVSITTLCGVAVAPWLENFDGSQWINGVGALNASNIISPCWTRPSSANPNFGPNQGPTGSGNTGPNQDFSGTGQYIYTEASGGAVGAGEIRSPQIFIPTSMGQPTLSFYYHMHGASIDSLTLEIDDGSGYSSVFSLVGEQQTSSGEAWRRGQVLLNSYSGDTIRLRFRGSNSGFTGDIALDEVRIEDLPCPPPTGLNITTLTSNSAALAWTSGGASQWEAEYGPVGFLPGTGTRVVLNSNPGLITGLQPNSTYDFYLRDSCGPGQVSSWVGPVIGSTLCGAVTAPYREDFEGSDWVPGTGGANQGNLISPCWQRPNPNAPNFGSNTGATSSFGTGPIGGAQGSTQYIYTEFSGVTAAFGEITSVPVVIPSSFISPSLSFAYHLFGAAIDSLTVEVIRGASDSLVFSLVGGQQSANTDPWQTATVDLSSYLGDTIEVRFRGYGAGFQSDIAIDDFEIFDLSCPEPSNLQATGNTGTSIDLSWTTGGAAHWQIEYGPVGFILGSGTRVAVSSNPFTLSGLQAASNYHIYLRDSCGVGDLSNWVGPLLASTACDTILAPWTENFDLGFLGGTDGATAQNDSATIGPCWSRDRDSLYFWGGRSGTTATGGTGPFGDNTTGTGSYVFVEASFAPGGTVARLESPVLNLDSLNYPELRFWRHMWAANGSMGTLVWSIDTGNGQWLLLDSLSGDQGFTWQESVTDLRAFAGKDVVIRFEATKSNGPTAQQGDIAIDDFSILEGIACPDPDSLALVSASTDQMTIDWNFGVATQAQIRVRGGGLNLLLSAGSSPFTINGLSAQTTYEVCVRDSCGPGLTSAWICDSLTTTCGVFTAPFSENFDGSSWAPGALISNAGNSIDPCWSRPAETALHFGPYNQPTGSAATGPNQDVSGGGNFLYVEASGTGPGSFGEITSPLIHIPSTFQSPELRFAYHMVGGDIDSLVLAIERGGNRQSVFQLSGAQQSLESDPFLTAVVPLGSNYVGDTLRLVFRGYVNGFQGDVGIDEVNLLDPNCPAPDSLQIDSAGLNQVALSWQGTGSNWQLEYGPIGFNPGAGTRISGVTSPYVVTGLNPGSFYQFFLRDSCSATDTSLWVGPIQAQTLCSQLSAPTLENFDLGFDPGSGGGNQGSTISLCWNRNTATGYHWGGNSGATPSTGTGPAADRTTGTGSYVYTEASVGTSGDTAILTSPDIDLSALTNPELRFWAHLYSQSGANIKLWWEVESGGNWQVLDSLQGDQGTAWIRQVSDLSAYSGQTVRFRFIAIKPSTASVFQGDVALDDFEIAEAVTCPVLAYPFTENFDGANWSTGSGALNGGDLIDVCWSRPLSAGNLWGTGTATTPSANTGPNLDVSGSGNYLYTEASRGNGPAWINTPRIFLDTNLQTPYLYFAYHMHGADIDSLRIELQANGGSWNNLYALAGQQQSAANLPWRQDSVDLSAYHGDTVVIRFRGLSSGFQGDVAIDEVRVDELPAPCGEPINFTVGAPTPSSLQISWNTQNPGAIPVLRYYPRASGPGAAITLSGIASPYTLSGLLSNTAYVIGLYDSCGVAQVSNFVWDSASTAPCPLVTATFNANDNLLQVSFNSGATANADSLSWDFGDGNQSNAQNPTHSYVAPGLYTVQLIASNACGNSDTAVQQIQVCDSLIARFVQNTRADTLIFNASGSTGASSYRWDFGDGNSDTAVSGRHSFGTTGTYVVSLTVYNDCDDSARISRTISVCGAPVADWTYTILPPTGSGMRIQFDASASLNAVTYDWDFGDGNTATGVNPIHVYATPGLFYFVRLRITNPCGDRSVKAFQLSSIDLPEELAGGFALYPVPNNGQFTLQWPRGEQVYSLRLHDGQGRLLRQLDLSEAREETRLDLRPLQPGVYWLHLETSRGEVLRKLQVVRP